MWGCFDCSDRVLALWQPRHKGWTLCPSSVPPEPTGWTWSITMLEAGCQVPHPVQEEPPWVFTLRRSRWAPPPAPRILR